MPTSETIQFQATPDFRQRLEAEAVRLQLSMSAYILYLYDRARQGSQDAGRLDRHVRDVFGKHGELMRRLAK